MYSSFFQNLVTFVLWFGAGIFFIHIICAAIIDRLETRAKWPPILDERDDDTTDTGPK